MNGTYQEPEVQDLGEGAEQSSEAPQVKGGKATKAVATVAPADPKFVDEQTEDLGLSRLLNAKGDAVTDLFVERVKRHVEFLGGKKGFKDDDARIKEQTSFMDTIGRTLTLEFEKYVVVTDFILKQIRDNKEVFSGGIAFRFTRDLGDKYPHQDVETYKSYITLLVMISNNWAVRYKLNKMIDPAYAIQHLPKAGKQNVTQYMGHLQRSV